MRETFTYEQYEKMLKQYGGKSEVAIEIFSNGFISQILSAIQQNISKENEMVKRSIGQSEADRKRAEILLEKEEDLLSNKLKVKKIEELKELKEQLTGNDELDNSNFHK